MVRRRHLRGYGVASAPGRLNPPTAPAATGHDGSVSRFARLVIPLEPTAEPPILAGQSLFGRFVAEVKWAFTPPWNWLGGVGANLLLSLLWLLWTPLTGRSHGSWIVLVGTYFAVFILADVTTTNVLGADAERVRLNLSQDVPVTRLLITKNLVLVAVVGLPTLLLTAALTLTNTSSYRLVMTLPGVALPILAWLGVGNLVSVLLPVPVKPLQQRWRERHDRRATFRWLFHLALPYLLLYEVDKANAIPRLLMRTLPRHSHTPELMGIFFSGTGALLWAAGTMAATWTIHRRGFHLPASNGQPAMTVHR